MILNEIEFPTLFSRPLRSSPFFYFRTIWVPQLGQFTWKQGTPA